MIPKRRAMGGILIFFLILTWGCAPKVISPDTGVFQHGRLYANSSKDLNAVYEAALAALSKFEFQINKKAKDVFFAEILAISADKKNITITIRKQGDTGTDYQIAFEAFNKERTLAIYNEMQKFLDAKPGK